MIEGIVGSESAKFTEFGEAMARAIITEIIASPECTGVVSGECHLGGIDIWAHEIADELGKPFTGFAPYCHAWSEGYKPRNLQIASASDRVHSITVNRFPDDYDGEGMQVQHCYHCKVDTHIRSGGCWTMLRAGEMGKLMELHVVEQ